MTFVKIESIFEFNVRGGREDIKKIHTLGEVFQLTISRSDPKVSCYWISCAPHILYMTEDDVTPMVTINYLI